MATGTVRVIGNIMATQRPLDEHYLNEGAPWATTAAALAGIPSGSRSPGKPVNVAGVLYWFNTAMTDLVTVFSASTPTASDVAIVDSGGLYDATEVEAALAEVKAQADATDVAIAALGDGAIQVTYAIRLGAYSTVAARVAAATVTTDYPTGWTLAANSTVNLLVTHNLTGRKVAAVNVFEIDGANERLLKPFEAAYSGCLVNGLTVLIEGLAPTVLAIRIEIIVGI